jgi:predicted DNA-binding transcriptional regulator YafY
MDSEKKGKGDAKKRPDADRRVRQAGRFARILKLLERLPSRVRHNAGSLATELGVTRRTVQRNLDVLELAGVNCVYDAVQGGYVLRGDYRFAVTCLTNEELMGQATATALTSAKGLNVGMGAEPTTRKLRGTGRESSRSLLEDALRVTSVLDLKLADHEGHRDTNRVILALIRRKRVEVCFTPDAAALVIETTWHHTQRVHRNDDGSVALTFQIDGLEEIVWWLLGWSGRVEIVAPAELRSLYVSHLKKAIAMNDG